MSGTVEDPYAWKSFADADLQAARILAERIDVETLAHVIVSHAHQSAEKYLKGFLATCEQKELPRVHNLRLLLTRSIQYLPALDSPELEDAANGLDQFYIPSRYPLEIGGPEGPISARESKEALTWAETLSTEIRPYLGG